MKMLSNVIPQADEWRRKYDKYDTPWELLKGLERCNGQIYSTANQVPAGELYPRGLTTFKDMSQEEKDEGYSRCVLLTKKGKALHKALLEHLNTFKL